jgi:hypothetical protein
MPARAAAKILDGRLVFLSASFPSAERDVAHHESADPDEITQAVVAVARATFAAGGRLTFGGHPTISPLIMMTAEDYLPASLKERRALGVPPVLIFQSKAFAGSVPSSTLAMARLQLGTIRWTPPAPSERARMRGRPDPANFTRSLAAMRRRMLGDPALAAAVFVGGMEGIEQEAAFFAQLQPTRPRYFLGAPGGAARRLALQRLADGPPRDRAWLRDLAYSDDYPALVQRIILNVAQTLRRSSR